MLVLGSLWVASGIAPGADIPQTPRIDSVVPSPVQPQATDPAVIWYDDFDGPEKPYTESQGGLDDKVALGGQGRSMLTLYEKGTRGIGNRKVFFGDSPTGKVVRKGESFDDVYWRVYVKHQAGWTGGGPAKLSRATSIVSPRWNQAMIAHVWSSGESLTLDPASGVRGNQVVTTRYNDFPNLRWLGNKPVAQLKLFSSEEAGRWICIESRAKLNTTGKRDGLNQLWIDGHLQAERKNLDWRGSYDRHGINAVFLETYWNDGSPVTQRRWIDNFVISTQPIGPVVCPRSPDLLKTPYHGPGECAGWEVEVASDDQGREVVWRSGLLTAASRGKVDGEHGAFLGRLSGRSELGGGEVYYFRVRQRSTTGTTSDWSPWHQPVKTEGQR